MSYTMQELQEEAAYWRRLAETAAERGMPRTDAVGVGACLASIEREIAERKASCPCEEEH